MGDNFVSFYREVRCRLSESSRIERDSHVRDLFGPGRDLNLALLQFFGSERACGMEDQGIVLHGFLLWAGGLGRGLGRGFGMDGLAKNGGAGEQREREQAAHVALCEAAPSGDAGTAKVISHASNVANAERLLLVKSRQIARGSAAKKLFRRCAGEEPEVAHHVRLIVVTGLKGDLRKAFSGVPQPADMLQTGQTGEPLGRRAYCGAEVSFQRALAHGGMTRNRCNGRPAFGVADHLCRRLNLRRDALRRASVLCTDLTGEKAFHCEDLLPYLACIGKDVLDVVDLLARQDGVERYRLVVEKVDAVVQYGRGANLSEPNDNHRGARRVLDHAGSLLQAGDDCAGKSLVVQQCRARLPQRKRERGLRQENLYPGTLRADPQNLAHVAAKGASWLVDEMAHLTHCYLG